MIKTIRLKVKGYYLFESLAGARSCYFETDKECIYFRKLYKRYLGNYIYIHKMYLNSEGYQILLKLRGLEVIKREYIKSCKSRNKEISTLFLDEPWRIISEQIRIFHSVYVRAVNRNRERKGVLVQERYSRYYFESKEELEGYIIQMDSRREIKGQKTKRYRVSESLKKGVDWRVVRSVIWVEKLMDKVFQDLIVSKLISSTLKTHHTPFSP